MIPRQSAGPLGLVCLASGIIYAACTALRLSGSMAGGFLVIGLAVSGFAVAAILGGVWLEQRLWNRERTGLAWSIAVGLLFALGASALVISFVYIGFFSLVGLLVTLFTAASLYAGYKLALAAAKGMRTPLCGLAGAALLLAGIGVNAFMLFRL